LTTSILRLGETITPVETQNVFPGTLHNRKPNASRAERHFEQFWHKTAALLFAVGKNNAQVAEECGVSSETIRALARTGWFQEMVSKIIADNGGRDMVEIFRRDAIEAHGLLVELRQNEKTPVSLRAKLATDAVERYHGKATQRVEHGTIASADPVAEVAELERQLENLRAAQSPGLS
jgi:hypothetical protein